MFYSGAMNGWVLGWRHHFTPRSHQWSQKGQRRSRAPRASESNQGVANHTVLNGMTKVHWRGATPKKLSRDHVHGRTGLRQSGAQSTLPHVGFPQPQQQQRVCWWWQHSKVARVGSGTWSTLNVDVRPGGFSSLLKAGYRLRQTSLYWLHVGHIFKLFFTTIWTTNVIFKKMKA